ncbi:MAG: sulfotransferase family 2 domain-containing protein [Planctomycetota bacterium]
MHIPALALNLCLIPSNGRRTLLDVIRRWIAPGQQPANSLPNCPVAALDRRDRGDLLSACPTAVFLRHPLHRLASTFNARVVWGDDRRPVNAIKHEIAQTYGLCPPHANAAGLTFREFILHCARTPDADLHERWRPQAAFTEGLSIDFIGNAERLDTDVPHLAATLGHRPIMPLRAPPAVAPPTPWQGPSMSEVSSLNLRSAGLCPPPAALFTPGLAEIALDRYRADLDLLEAGGLIDEPARGPGAQWAPAPEAPPAPAPRSRERASGPTPKPEPGSD